MTNPGESDWVTVGRIRTAYGVKGWLKAESFTEPAENIHGYANWRICPAGTNRKVAQTLSVAAVDAVEQRQDQLLVHLENIDNREQARLYANALIQVHRRELPALEEDEFYWHQLQGLAVYQLAADGGEPRRVGSVHSLMETGANDVLVVRPEPGSGNKGGKTENGKDKPADILIPYLPGEVVKSVDLEQGSLLVDWYYD